MVVGINNLTRKHIDSDIIKKAARSVLMLLKKKEKFEISIALVGEKRMRSLNRKFRNKDKPTDVLSFDFQEKTGNKNVFLGEVVICLPYAEKQAKKLGISFKENLATLTAHGVIHLCGIDHERSQKEYKRTLEIQKQVLNSIKSKVYKVYECREATQ